MKAYLFPGQGSQAKGMGAELFDRFSGLTAEADRILGYSIKDLCLSDPRRELNRTEFTQPAVYVVNALSYLRKTEESGAKPDYVAGHSLGEFNALLAAEAFTFEVGLKIVKRRGEIMGRISGGAMAAILNASKEDIETVLRENGLTGIDLANYNTPLQIVISGPKDQITQAETLFRKGKVRYYPLNTSGAFHSRYMKAARSEFESQLRAFDFAKPRIPVISNVSARPYGDGEIVEKLSDQLTHSVRWSESIQYLMGLGDVTFEEVGHGDVLTKMIRQIDESVAPRAAEAPLRDAPTGALAHGGAEQQSGAPALAARGRAPVNVSMTAGEKVERWNKHHAVGTKVKSARVEGEGLKTRTEATVLFGHRAAVYIEGFKGYFDLDELTALP